MITWDGLVKLEPRLKNLEKDVLNYLRRDGCINTVWYKQGGTKSKITNLVGFYRIESPNDCGDLYSNEAYDTVTRHLYSLQPNCETDCETCNAERRKSIG